MKCFGKNTLRCIRDYNSAGGRKILNIKSIIELIMRGRGSDPETHCPHKKMHSFCNNGPISKILTALKSWDSRACDGLNRNIKFQVSNVQNWARMWKSRFWALSRIHFFLRNTSQNPTQTEYFVLVSFSLTNQGVSQRLRNSELGSHIRCKNCTTKHLPPPFVLVSR